MFLGLYLSPSFQDVWFHSVIIGGSQPDKSPGASSSVRYVVPLKPCQSEQFGSSPFLC